VTTPAELAEALDASPDARRAYDALPPSHRREYDLWIDEAKKPETRRRRAASAPAIAGSIAAARSRASSRRAVNSASRCALGNRRAASAAIAVTRSR
jgi:hypothetical protein